MKTKVLNLIGYLIVIGLPVLIVMLLIFKSNGNYVTDFVLNN